MEGKTCTMCNMEKTYQQFLQKHTQIAQTVIAQGGLNVTMKTKIKYRINRNYIMKKQRKKNYYKNKTIDGYNLKT